MAMREVMWCHYCPNHKENKGRLNMKNAYIMIILNLIKLINQLNVYKTSNYANKSIKCL